MGISRIAYYFDIDRFKTTFKSIIRELELNDFGNLRKIATEKAKRNPNLWKIMDQFRYSQSDLEQEEDQFDTLESRVMFWIHILIADSCDVVEDPVDARTIGEKLLLLNIDRKIISQLQLGRPLGVLLKPKTPEDDWPFWCKRYNAGWLGVSDCEEIIGVFREKRTTLESRSNDFGSGLQDVKWILDNLLKMLIGAVNLNKGLFLGFSD
jgi:hypothetical protein